MGFIVGIIVALIAIVVAVGFFLLSSKKPKVGYICPDLVRPDDFSPRPNNVHETVLREREKQKIREEIIAAEEKRRQLETEVMREILIEREMALRGTHGFPIFSSPQSMVMNSRFPIINYSENSFKDASPFSRCSETKATPEVNKERIIFLPRPEGNISAIKRQVTIPPTRNVLIPSADAKKKKKEMFRCELCQVSATSEGTLKSHFRGKKHKSREARQSSSHVKGQNFTVGLFSRKVIDRSNKLPKREGNVSVNKHKATTPPAPNVSIPSADPKMKKKEMFRCDLCQVSATSERDLKVHFQGRKHKSIEGTQPSQVNNKVLEKNSISKETDDVALQLNKNPEVVKKDDVAATAEKDSLRFTFWCPMCKTGAFSENVMNAHMRGKKHTSRLAAGN